MTFSPTAEQQEILDFVAKSSANLIINARAGAAKTTTLTMLVKELRGKEILCLAFNKKTAEEMAEKMADPETKLLQHGLNVRTLNSVGNTAVKDFLGRFPKLDDGKLYNLFSRRLDQEQDTEFLSYAQENFADILSVIKEAKVLGYVPPGKYEKSMPSLYTREGFFESVDFICSHEVAELVDAVLSASIGLALDQGIVDFADQIYLSALHRYISFNSYDVVMVDEAQDLSPLNHVMLRKIVGRRSRLIAVGDEAQAIYGFRGADERSMAKLESMFEMEPRSLTVCFRCARKIVENARWRAPDMQWAENAPEGTVVTLPQWDASTLQPGDVIISRNNAPLFAMALQLLKEGKRPELAAGDIFRKVEMVFAKLGKNTSISAEEAKEKLASWYEAERKKKRDDKLINELNQSVLFFLDSAETLGGARALYTQIKNSKGSIQLYTGHRAKGKEWDRVLFLDPRLVGKEGQERNIQYVIETRAKSWLAYVESETFEGAE